MDSRSYAVILGEQEEKFWANDLEMSCEFNDLSIKERYWGHLSCRFTAASLVIYTSWSIAPFITISRGAGGQISPWAFKDPY